MSLESKWKEQNILVTGGAKESINQIANALETGLIDDKKFCMKV